MEREHSNLKRLNACSELLNYRAKKTPCYDCIQFKEMIDQQNKIIMEMRDDHKNLREQVSKLQATTVDQNKIIVEMLTEQKLQLQGLQKVRQSINTLIQKFPIKTEDDLKKIEADINEANEEKYISAIKDVLCGSAIKNLERVLSRELCVMYNTDGICGKKSLRDYKNFYKTVIDAISSYSTSAEKEMRDALQVVKKRHFRFVCAKKKSTQQINSNSLP